MSMMRAKIQVWVEGLSQAQKEEIYRRNRELGIRVEFLRKAPANRGWIDQILEASV